MLQHAVEMYVSFLPTMLFGGFAFPLTNAVAGFAFLLGNLVYAMGYYTGIKTYTA